ncbi:MAG TPA: hypothetical protein VHG35_14425 [Gemmatimonadales bacterium]|nr:hypothetical protein [Gemmatimonadales bacterium]
MPRVSRPILAVLLILLASCAEPTDPVAVADIRQSATITNGPTSPGPIVLRGQDDEFIFLVPDLADGLTASIGTPDLFSAWCDPFAPVTVVPYDFQSLSKPNGQIGELLKADALPVIIYGVGTVEFCPDLDGAPVVATGTARFVENDRDFADPPSFGYRATGTVTFTAGGTANFTGTVKWVTTGSGQVRVRSNVILTPTLGGR